MMKRLLGKLLIPATLFALISAYSCSSFDTVYQTGVDTVNVVTDLVTPDPEPVLKKKLIFAPVINQTKMSSIDGLIKKGMISFLQRDEFLLVSSMETDSIKNVNSEGVQYGIVIDSEQVEKAREMGMNILVSCVFHPIETEIKRKGIWPLRKNRRVVSISISVNAIDTTNNTLVVSRNETLNVKTDEQNPEFTSKWDPDISLLEREIPVVLEKLSSEISEKLFEYPWQSRVSISESNTYFVNAGRDVGIDENTRFDLFKKGESIQSLTGEEYFIFGDKIGEIGVESVSQSRSVLAMSSADNASAEFIRVKRLEN